MKNINVIPTEKPSRLVKQKYDTIDRLCLADMATKRVEYKRFNLYITNSEEIKIDEYYIHGNRLHKHLGKKCLDVLTDKEYPQSNLINKDSVFKKVILSTDLELQKDGVQAIDDEFLEWFVNNPSCERVEVEWLGTYTYGIVGYKIIIPKEEPKQTELIKGISKGTFNMIIGKSKQETLEEAKIKHTKFCIENNIENPSFSFDKGAKWQQERSYSEEEVLNKLTHFAVEIQRQNKQGIVPLRIKEWFERNKKK